MLFRSGDVVHAAKKLIADAVLAREQNLVERVHNIDALVHEIVREVGRTSTEEDANATAQTESARIAAADELTAQHRERTPFLPSSGRSKSSRRTSGTRRRK